METDEGLRHLLKEIARVEPASAQAGVGDVLGRYQLVRELGRGGFGVVFAARDPELGREIALKVMRSRDGSEALREQFHREASIVAKLKHPHIVTLYDWSSNPPYLVLELLTGETLEERLKRGPLPVDEALDLALAVAGALQHAHARGAVHRDLKPSNVFLCSDGVAKVLDFGLAHDGSGAGLLEGAGTPAYMAPEQRAQKTGDARSDVWAFGAVLAEMVTGKRATSTLMSLAMLPTAAKPLGPVIAKAMADSPNARFADGGALFVELNGVRTRLRAAAADRRRRRRYLAAVGAAALGLAGVVMTMQAVSGSRVRAAAEAAAEVNRIEAELRYAHLMPEHDLREDEKRARRELSELEQRLEGRGRFAQGRGELALGRGLLALGDPAAAIPHLRALGDSDDEVRRTLGEALGAEWERQVNQSELIRDDDERRDKMERIDRELRQPAAKLLEASHAESALTLARLALLRHEPKEALRLAEKAAADAPWLYEADLVAARIHQEAAQAAYHAGKFDDAVASLDRADAASARALAMGRSDPSVAGDACARASLRFDIGWRRAKGDSEAEKAARAACDRAIAIAPDRPLFYERAASLRLAEITETHADRPRMTTLWGEAEALAAQAVTSCGGSDEARTLTTMVAAHKALRLMNLGEDVLPLIEKAEPEAEALVKKNGDARNSDNLGDLLFAKILAQINLGIDPTPACAVVEKLFANAHLPAALGRLGRIETMRGEWESAHGVDPFPSWQRAIDAYQGILVREPGNAKMLDELSAVYYDEALHAMAHGNDGSDAFRRSVELSERGLTLRPDNPVALANLGVTLADWAQGESKWGRSPEKALDRAREVLTKSSQLEPGAPDTWYTLSIEERARAEWLLDEKRDATEALAAGRAAAKKAIALSPQTVALLAANADINRVEARRIALEGRSPLALLAAAQADYERERAVDKDNQAVAVALADIALCRLSWMCDHGCAAGDVDKVLAQLSSLASGPRPPLDTFRMQARAFTIAAKVASTPDRKRDMAAQAKLALSRVAWPQIRNEQQAELERVTAQR